MSEDGDFTLFQLPFLRLCVGERSAVAMFFLITGYVNSIGPLAKVRARRVEAAFFGIARSALARSGRLVLPAMFATLFSWLLAQLQAYKMAEHIDATWIRQGYHPPEATLLAAVQRLVSAEIRTWTVGWNEYDGVQWTLLLFLQASFTVYMTMVSTIMATPKARRLIYVALYIYGWLTEQGPVTTMNIAVGMLVADLHNEYGTSATSLLPRLVSTLIIVVGLFFCCFPQQNAEWSLWSNAMQNFMLALIPPEADVRRYWDSIGASILFVGIFFSSTARNLLTTPAFNFLGRVSFPVYLLHNQLMKSLLTWLIYFPSWLNPPMDENGNQKDLERGSPLHIAVALAVFYYLLYHLAALWMKYIDPICAKITKSATSWAFDEGHMDKGILTT